MLYPAFKKVGNESSLPANSRWRCTFETSNLIEGYNGWSLDDLLEHYGHERRKVGKYHTATDDCELTAKVYKDMFKLFPTKSSTLGFTFDE